MCERTGPHQNAAACCWCGGPKKFQDDRQHWWCSEHCPGRTKYLTALMFRDKAST